MFCNKLVKEGNSRIETKKRPGLRKKTRQKGWKNWIVITICINTEIRRTMRSTNWLRDSKSVVIDNDLNLIASCSKNCREKMDKMISMNSLQ